MKKKILPLLASSVMLSFVASCASLSSKNSSAEGQTITRISFENSCPVVREKQQSLTGAVALAVVSPLIEAAVKGVGGAIKKAGEVKSFSTSSVDSVEFYSFDFEGQQLILSPQARCMVVFRAKVGDGEISDVFKNNIAFMDGDQSRADRLNQDYGIIDTPSFYYEATLQPSVDKTAFKIEPQFIYYGKNIGKSKNVNALVLNIAFGTPAATIEDKAFGLYTTTFRYNKGSSLVANSSSLLAGHNSKFIPLPQSSETAKSSLKLFVEQDSQVNTFNNQLEKLDRAIDPRVGNIQGQIASIQVQIADLVKKARVALDRRVQDCNRDTECDQATDSDVIKLARALEDAINSTTLKRELLVAQNALQVLELGLNRNGQRQALKKSVAVLNEKLVVSETVLKQSTPVNVSVTLTETSNANKFLVALGEALEGAADDAKTKATELLTPENKEEKLSAEITELKELNTLRATAITSVGAWSGLNTEYTAASEAKKPELLSTLRIAYFKAKLDCDIVTKYGVVEPSCFTLVDP